MIFLIFMGFLFIGLIEKEKKETKLIKKKQRKLELKNQMCGVGPEPTLFISWAFFLSPGLRCCCVNQMKIKQHNINLRVSLKKIKENKW